MKTKKHHKIDVFFAKDKDWRWRLVAPNGKIVLQGEGHESPSKAVRAVTAAQAAFGDADIVIKPRAAAAAPQKAQSKKKVRRRRLRSDKGVKRGSKKSKTNGNGQDAVTTAAAAH